MTNNKNSIVPFVVLGIAVTLAALFALLIGRLYVNSAKYHKRAVAVEATDPHQAILWHGEAMRAYVPVLHPHFHKSHSALVRLANAAIRAGDNKLALDAYEEISASIRSVRSFYQPYSDLLRESDKRRDEILARISKDEKTDPGGSETTD